ncbi:hypothetical protein L1987_51751 [Smallanthus sonchifolius]|uniref:Uncharacterized protein n=1 Tax=Smallanthus sonchifolius TaxID=185202 RepID=A0ACB9EQX2_9ASTR|nr:hypothetical protein L1987_51751 [Smallanthus sonchifolius]
MVEIMGNQLMISISSSFVFSKESWLPLLCVEALNPKETIGSFGVRNFMLCKKPPQVVEITRKRSSSSWKSCFNKTLTLKVTPH